MNILKELKTKYSGNLLNIDGIQNPKIFTLSDLQIPHTNLLKYEENTRILFAGLKFSDGKLLDAKSFNLLDNEEKEKFVIQSSRFIISQYGKKISENYDNFNVFADLGDFIFNISNDKVEFLHRTGLFNEIKEIFDNLKKQGKYRILVLGNHDNVKFVPFYLNFFDEIRNSIIEIDDINNEFRLYSHYPFCKYEYVRENDELILLDRDINKDKYKSEYENSRRYDNLGEIIEKNNLNIKFVNYHGHTHSNNPLEIVKFNGLKYINRCIDNLIVNG